MGKHNGKARPSGGASVGGALVNRAGKGAAQRLANPNAQWMHTTEPAGLQSNLEANDLAELMDMAQLANRDFAAERGSAVIIASGAGSALDRDRSLADRRQAEQRSLHRLRIPRRPAWDPGMSAEAVDAQERAAFVAWRRELAALEEEEGLVLTPFEKNLEVWRQLWRVLERSHIVVQVVDARDPLLYRSEDLEAYARELAPAKASLLLLNKADLLSARARAAWADHFDARGAAYIFWSAKAAAEGQAPEPQAGEDARTRIVGCEELVELLGRAAQRAIDAGGAAARHGAAEERGDGRRLVGLTGYPNVGKSSTINALFGSKKTTVSATPGKTKHFQTLNVAAGLTLVDCPGLVLPRFAASKAALVAAGVIPIDRLTDVRGPVEVVAAKIPRAQLEAVYGLQLPPPAPHKPRDRAPSAAELLRAVAVARGWCSGSGLPDETRAGRTLLKDYTSGKLRFAEWPPGQVPAAAAAGSSDSAGGGQAAAVAADCSGRPADGASSSSGDEREAGGAEAGPAAGSGLPEDFGEADLDLLQSLNVQSASAKPKRPEYKFNKKPARSKGKRGKAEDAGGPYDGAAMRTGKHGGLVRVS